MPFPKDLEERFELVETLTRVRGFECFRVVEKRTVRGQFLIRVLPPDLCRDNSVIDEFHLFFGKFSEIPNRTHIPFVYGFSGVPGGTVYVVEEYVSGIPLSQFSLARQGSPDFHHNMLDVITRVCEALHHAHQRSIFHLCITPQDILIDPGSPRKVKLVGFGAPIFLKGGHLKSFSEQARHFLAPEILEGAHSHPSADIYSLAASVKQACPDIEEWNGFLSKCLSSKVSDRPSRSREFGQGLKTLLETKTVQHEEVPLKSPRSGGLQPLLTIRTDPVGAEVRTNGNVLGVTTGAGLSVPWQQGTVIEVGKPGFQPETLSFDAPPSETEITVKLTSAFKLFTNPWGASVLVDGQVVGTTSRDGLIVPWDGVRIEIEKLGYTRELLRFDTPPTESETPVELQPATSAGLKVAKRHWLEVAGYVLGLSALLFLPVIFFIGMRGGSNLSQESDQLRQEISRLSFALSGKEQDNEALRQSNAQGSQEVRNLQDRVKQIESEKLVEKMAEGLSATIQSDRGQLGLAQQRLLEKDKEFQALKDELARNRAENRRQEEEIARLKTVSQQPPTVQRRFIDPQLSGQLLLACREGQTWMVDNLLAKGADPNARGLGLLAYTPLIVASRDGNHALVRLLLKHGADINLRAQSGWKAEDFARANNFHSVLTILRSHSP